MYLYHVIFITVNRYGINCTKNKVPTCSGSCGSQIVVQRRFQKALNITDCRKYALAGSHVLLNQITKASKFIFLALLRIMNFILVEDVCMYVCVIFIVKLEIIYLR
jgi:hypothetical protein